MRMHLITIDIDLYIYIIIIIIIITTTIILIAEDSSKGVQWKQGVVLYTIHTSLLYNICLRPISLLTLSLLRLLESNFPGNSLWAWEFIPLKLRLCWSQNLRNPQC